VVLDDADDVEVEEGQGVRDPGQHGDGGCGQFAPGGPGVGAAARAVAGAAASRPRRAPTVRVGAASR
ncbi:hypothetical protein BU198_35825, partial [Streptomyces sp. CBMA156]|nr:hypothetical protein [Streptomyces sp. CBMA156]